MTEQNKRREPSVLDRLFNITVNDRDFKKMLIKKAETLPAQCFDEELCERDARKQIVKQLTDWVYESGFTGRQTKKMVEKAAARVLKGYREKMRHYYRQRLVHHEELARTSTDYLTRLTSEMEADKLRERIKDGRYGKERHPPWPRGRR